MTSIKATFVLVAFLSSLPSIFSLPLAKGSSDSSTRQSQNGQKEYLECLVCEVAIQTLQEGFNQNKTFEEIYPLAVTICISVVNRIHFDGEYMCPGLVSAYGPVFQTVLGRVFLDPYAICEDLNICSSTSPFELSDLSSSLRKIVHKMVGNTSGGITSGGITSREALLSDKDMNSRSLLSTDDANQKHRKPRTKKYVKPKSGRITFLQISDIHLDSNYDEGSPTECDLYFCCRSWYNGNGSAGRYGSYNCDIPKVTLDLLLETAQSLDPAPDFILYTGDNPPHDMWNQTWNSSLRDTQMVVDYLASKFPNVTIYPAIGNHESWPQSEYLGTLQEYQALTKNLSVMWEKWVDLSFEARASIAHGGYYSLKVMDGLRIVSFNSDYGYVYNFYAYLNSENSQYSEQWLWLNKELRQAREKEEKVLLMGHIPPGDTDNWEDYGQFYLNLTKQYSDTIVGHFFGHTHMDHFQLIQDGDGVYGVVLVAPSVTTFGHINPSFRTFTMDTDSMKLLNYTQYHLNITKANALYLSGRDKEVEFEVSYSTDTEYNMEDLTPDSWKKLSKKFLSNSKFLNSYYYNRYGKSKEENRICDSSCQKKILCEVNNIVSTEALACEVE